MSSLTTFTFSCSHCTTFTICVVVKVTVQQVFGERGAESAQNALVGVDDQRLSVHVSVHDSLGCDQRMFKNMHE